MSWKFCHQTRRLKDKISELLLEHSCGRVMELLCYKLFHFKFLWGLKYNFTFLWMYILPFHLVYLFNYLLFGSNFRHLKAELMHMIIWSTSVA